MAITGVCPVCKVAVELVKSGHLAPHKHRRLLPSSPNCPGTGAMPNPPPAPKRKRTRTPKK